MSSNNTNNGFFDDFTTITPTNDSSKTNGTMDLSKILDLAASMKSNVAGYVGTDTMPDCKKGVCWYIYEKVFNITQD